MSIECERNTMRPIYLIGYDGQAASRAAVRLAAALAGPCSAEVIAANVLAEQLGPKEWADARAAAGAMLDGLGDDVTRRRVVEGPAAHGLHDLAVEYGASLLFVGATHRGAVGRLLPGSVGERLIHAAPCPLVIVPEGTDGPVATIGVAFDGRDPSRSALQMASALAAEHHARLVLITVAEAPSAPGWRFAHRAEQAASSDAVQQLFATATALIPDEIVVEHRALSGQAGPTLVTACGDAIDLLVVGSRGYGPLHSVLAGSVARHLADHAPCPVVIAPRVHVRERRPHAASTATAVA